MALTTLLLCTHTTRTRTYHQGGNLGRSRGPKGGEHVHRHGAGLEGGRVAPRRWLPVRVGRRLRCVRQADQVKNEKKMRKQPHTHKNTKLTKQIKK